MQNKASGEEWIWGRHSVEACLENYPELIHEIFIEKAAQKRNSDLQKILQDSGLRFNVVEKLPRILAEKRTQGISAKIKKFPVDHFNIDHPLFSGPKKVQGLLLDRIQDPQNFGAILRSAAALKADFVIVGMREQCPITGTVAQVSAGNLFRVKIMTSLNLAKAALDLKEQGFAVWALESDGKEIGPDLFAKTPKWLWVLGSEEEGIQAAVAKTATDSVSIPMKSGVESLNVSNSAAIALYLGSLQIG